MTFLFYLLQWHPHRLCGQPRLRGGFGTLGARNDKSSPLLTHPLLLLVITVLYR